VVDWDIEPTPYSEYVTLFAGDADELTYTSNHGFAPVDPLADPTENAEGPITVGEFVDSGPNDIGAMFDFSMGSYDPGESKNFTMYYGAAPTQTAAMTALTATGAEAYSIAKSSDGTSLDTGAPATFMIAFSGIGGDNVLDDSLPQTVLDSGPSGITNNTDANFGLSSPTSGATFECSYEESPWTSCAASQGVSGLSDGEYYFRARAVDGPLVDLTPVIARWTVDTVSPHVFIDNVDLTDGGSTAVFDLGYDSDEPNGFEYECSIDGTAFIGCGSTVALSGLVDGDHVLKVRGVDPAGNADDFSAPGIGEKYYWTSENGGIPDTILKTAPGTFATSSVEVKFKSDENNASFECSLDGAAFAGCSSPHTLTSLANGAHSFKVRAVDVTMQADPTPAELAFTVSVPAAPVVAPKISVTKPKSGATSLKLTFTCPTATCSVGGTLKVGKKKFKLSSEDLAGGEGSYTLKFPKKAKKAVKKAKKAKKKVSYSLTFVSGTEKKTLSGKF
jgi:hypothetical protein